MNPINRMLLRPKPLPGSFIFFIPILPNTYRAQEPEHQYLRYLREKFNTFPADSADKRRNLQTHKRSSPCFRQRSQGSNDAKKKIANL